MLLLDWLGIAFHVLLDPATTLEIGNVHEIRTDASAIIVACLAGYLSLDLQVRMSQGLQESERIKVGFEVSPTTEKIENALPFLHWRVENPRSTQPGLACSSSHYQLLE